MVLAIVLILIVVASVLFNFLSPWTFTPLASNWGSIDTTLNITLAITGAVFIAITAFIALALIRFRHRPGQVAHYEPENRRLEWWLIGLTTVGIVAMLTPGLFVYSDFVHVPEEAHEVEALGQQWQWRYRYPGEDGELGRSDVAHISAANPFGLDPDDPRGRDDILVNSGPMQLPLDRPVKVLLRSRDVLHDFYVPHFRVKMDLVPGTVTYFWLTPTRAGEYEILCAELCGVGHYNMRSKVVVTEAEAFEQWLAQQPRFAQSLSAGTVTADTGLAAKGRQLAEGLGCLACHSVDGAPGVGPGWQGLFGSERELADGGSAIADEAYLRESITDPKAKLVKGYPPVMQPYALNEDELAALIAYLRSLAADAADAAARGRDLAERHGCLACHSQDGSRGVGPSWQGLFGSERELADGGSATADTAYLRESITAPAAKLVKGYPPVMQPYALAEDELAALVDYLRGVGENE